MFDICKIFTNEKFADTDVEKAFNIKCVRLLNRNLSAAPAKPLQIEDVSLQIERLREDVSHQLPLQVFSQPSWLRWTSCISIRVLFGPSRE